MTIERTTHVKISETRSVSCDRLPDGDFLIRWTRQDGMVSTVTEVELTEAAAMATVKAMVGVVPSEKKQLTCPRCGANRVWSDATSTAFGCGSIGDGTGFTQTAQCKARSRANGGTE